MTKNIYGFMALLKFSLAAAASAYAWTSHDAYHVRAGFAASAVMALSGVQSLLARRRAPESIGP